MGFANTVGKGGYREESQNIFGEQRGGQWPNFGL